jgi:hypothetical protein
LENVSSTDKLTVAKSSRALLSDAEVVGSNPASLITLSSVGIHGLHGIAHAPFKKLSMLGAAA